MTLLKKSVDDEKSPRDSLASQGSAGAAAPPPAYSEQQPPNDAGIDLPPDFTSRLESLTLDPMRLKDTPTPDECIVHLKLLEAFFHLRQDIETSEGLFGITSPVQTEKKGSDEKAETEKEGLDPETELKLKQVREKRWAVYVSRAVDRYEEWFAEHVPKLTAGKPTGPLTTKSLLEDTWLHDEAGCVGERLRDFFPENLPPLDVVMVWHAHTLNPRIFFEDCLRDGCLDFWATGLPWASIDACIENTTFEYDVGEGAQVNWERGTGRAWDNLYDPMETELRCLCCTQATILSIPWSRNAGFPSGPAHEFAPGDGYADSDFVEVCPKCQTPITHETLQVARFRNDISRLLRDDVPLSGTVLDYLGRPPLRNSRRVPPAVFASVWIKDAFYVKLLEATNLREDPGASMDTVRVVFEDALSSKKLVSYLFPVQWKPY